MFTLFFLIFFFFRGEGTPSWPLPAFAPFPPYTLSLNVCIFFLFYFPLPGEGKPPCPLPAFEPFLPSTLSLNVCIFFLFLFLLPSDGEKQPAPHWATEMGRRIFCTLFSSLPSYSVFRSKYFMNHICPALSHSLTHSLCYSLSYSLCYLLNHSLTHSRFNSITGISFFYNQNLFLLFIQ